MSLDPPIPSVTLPEADDDRLLRRLLLAVKPVISRILKINEQIITVTEAVEVVGWRERRNLGSGWLATRRVALVLTNRRLIEMGLSSGGRRATGFVREHPWSSAMPPRLSDQVLALGEAYSWWLRRPLEPEIDAEINRLVEASTAQARRIGTAASWRLCPQCGATAPDSGGHCQRCGALRQSQRLAALLSLAIPGAGMRFVARPVFAALRVITEVAVFALIVVMLLMADGRGEAALVIAGSALTLLLVKAESMRMTRRLADRAGILGLDDAKAQRRRVAKGLLLSAAVAMVPILLAGVLSTEITGDLHAGAGHLGWTVSRDPDPGNAGDAARAMWQHRDGWWVRVTARALPPFRRTKTVRNRWYEDRDQAADVSVKRIKLGSHRTVRAIETGVGEDRARVRLQYFVIDEYGRDWHLLETEVAAADLETVDGHLQALIPCMYWVAPSAPQAATSGAAVPGQVVTEVEHVLGG